MYVSPSDRELSSPEAAIWASDSRSSSSSDALGTFDTTSYVTPHCVIMSDRTILRFILSVRLCRLYMLSARRFRKTRSIGAGCDNRTVVLSIKYTRSLAKKGWRLVFWVTGGFSSPMGKFYLAKNETKPRKL